MTAIALVISDVDGTLVTPDKVLTKASIEAVRRLHNHGIGFTVSSSRPPIGLRALIEALSLQLPLGAFNGGAIINPDLSVIEQHLIPEAAARRSLGVLSAFGADAWLFTTNAWLLINPDGAYVPLERKTIRSEPTLVTDFAPYLARAAKIVGSSADLPRLAACEAAMHEALGGDASVVRSQPYYLDVTPPRLDKGTVVEAIARHLAVPTAVIAVLGDMDNDLPMFRSAGVSIAMGNATPDVQRQATYVTASNAEDGFAQAVDRFILGNAPRERTT